MPIPVHPEAMGALERIMAAHGMGDQLSAAIRGEKMDEKECAACGGIVVTPITALIARGEESRTVTYCSDDCADLLTTVWNEAKS